MPTRTPILTSRNFSGDIMQVIPYKSIEIGYSLNTPTYINVEVEKSQIGTTSIEPYRYDFHLGPVDSSTNVVTGIWTGYRIEYYSEMVQLQGLDYLHYLERRTHDGLDGTPTAYTATNKRISLVIKELFDKAATNGVPYITSGIDTSVGPIINYRIEPGDSESLYSKIMSLADSASLYIRLQDKSVSLYGYSTAPAPSNDWSQFVHSETRVGLSVEYRGLIGTDVLTLAGTGASNTRLYAKSHNATARSNYRRHDNVIDLGNVADSTIVNQHNAQELQRSITTIKEIELVHRTFTSSYYHTWAPNWPGLFEIIPIYGLSIGADVINGDYRVIAATHRSDDGGVTFESTYKLDLASIFDAA